MPHDLRYLIHACYGRRDSPPYGEGHPYDRLPGYDPHNNAVEFDEDLLNEPKYITEEAGENVGAVEEEGEGEGVERPAEDEIE